MPERCTASAKNKVVKNSILLFLIFALTCCTTKKQQKEKNDYVFSTALACTFSEIVYCTQPQDTLNKYLPGWNIVWNPEPVNGNYAFAASDGKNLAIAIRGSVLEISDAAFENWVKQDLHVAVQNDWPFTDSIKDAKVSQGVYDAWKNLCTAKDKISGRTLLQFIDSFTITTTPVLVTGHSLGGNLATVYSSWLKTVLIKTKNREINLSVKTFAAPAAGNAQFADDFNNKFPDAERIENIHDIVPCFPVANAVGKISDLYKPAPSASEIDAGFSLLPIKLSNLFTGIKLTIQAIQLANGNSIYTHTKGTQITIPLSGKNNNHTLKDFFAEAGYQHSILQYAAALGAPQIHSE